MNDSLYKREIGAASVHMSILLWRKGACRTIVYENTRYSDSQNARIDTHAENRTFLGFLSTDFSNICTAVRHSNH